MNSRQIRGSDQNGFRSLPRKARRKTKGRATVKGARLIFCCICNTYATAHMQPFVLHMQQKPKKISCTSNLLHMQQSYINDSSFKDKASSNSRVSVKSETASACNFQVSSCSTWPAHAVPNSSCLSRSSVNCDTSE